MKQSACSGRHIFDPEKLWVQLQGSTNLLRASAAYVKDSSGSRLALQVLILQLLLQNGVLGGAANQGSLPQLKLDLRQPTAVRLWQSTGPDQAWQCLRKSLQQLSKLLGVIARRLRCLLQRLSREVRQTATVTRR